MKKTRLIQKIKDFVVEWPEVYSIACALFMFYASVYLIYYFDNTAAPLDLGVLHNILYAITAVIIFNGVVFLGIKVNFPHIYNFYKYELKNELTQWQKSKILLSLYLGLLAALVLSLKVLN